MDRRADHCRLCRRTLRHWSLRSLGPTPIEYKLTPWCNAFRPASMRHSVPLRPRRSAFSSFFTLEIAPFWFQRCAFSDPSRMFGFAFAQIRPCKQPPSSFSMEKGLSQQMGWDYLVARAQLWLSAWRSPAFRSVEDGDNLMPSDP
jgi:hypothetical protein